jgi:hypothetical protein
MIGASADENHALDAAILAYRADPSEENRARLMALQRAHVDHFYREMSAEYVSRVCPTRNAT